MKKGFTLLELLIVIIIIGVLAALGLTQYQAVVEKSRGAEARQVLSTLRSSCAAIWMQNATTANCTLGNLGLSLAKAYVAGEIPSTATNCWSTNYFRYGAAPAAPNGVVFTAMRCTTLDGGKQPGAAAAANTLTLTTDYAIGTDVWTSNGGY